MRRSASESSSLRFAAYVGELAGVLGHADRVMPLKAYCLGLMVGSERKSVEPLAALTAPDRVAAQHQSLLHFVGNAPWSDERLLTKIREVVQPALERSGPIEAWIVDDTGFPKKGRHSVGVARQYCGQLGKQDNCQVAVSLSIANREASLPIGYRLYLPEEWASDAARRRKAGVPEDIVFKTKPQIALDLIRQAHAQGVTPGTVLMDAGYGSSTELRQAISGLAIAYVAGIMPNTSVWPPGMMPLPAPPWSGRGGRPKRLRRDRQHQPVGVSTLAKDLPAEAWHAITWREGTSDWLTSRFARLRVRAAHRDERRATPRPEEWLLIEWPADETAPTKYWLSTLPENIPFDRLVDTTKLRWRIERDYQELKQEFGLDHFEGRRWRGFHHHASLCIAAYGFLVAERAAIPPSGPRSAPNLSLPALPHGYRPRGAADPARAPHPELDRHPAPIADRCAGSNPAAVPLLQCRQPAVRKNSRFLTQ
jgi:SRSO17 transposase